MTVYAKIKTVVSAAILIVLALCCGLNAMPRLDAMAGDLLMREGGTAAPEIVIIGIDDDSIDAMGRFPWPRSAYAALLYNLAQGGATVIAMDILFTESSDEAEDEALMEAMAYAGNVILPVQANIRVGQETMVGDDGLLLAHGIIEPIPMFAAQALALGHINAVPDDWDSYLRHGMVTFRDLGDGALIRPMGEIAYEQYCRLTGREMNTNLPRKHAQLPLVHFAGIPGTIAYYPFFAALDPDIIDPSEFEGKIVLVGAYATSLADQDAFFTPASGVQRMYGVEYHANIIGNMLYDEFVTPVPAWVSVAVLLVFGIASFVCYYVLRRVSAKLLVFAGAVLISAGGWFLLFQAGTAVSIAYLLTALLLLYLSDVIISYTEEFAEKRRITTIFGRYLAPQVLEKVIQEGEESLKLGGEERELTALFVDIRGFTTLSELLTPQEVVVLLNEYLTLATEAVFEFGGTLDKYIGDAVMALYNVPYEQDNHALRAVKSALAMQRNGVVLNAKLVEKYGRSVQFGVGVNTGRAVVGNIGSPTRMDYTSIGDMVNVAARLESNAKAGQVLISEAVYRQIKDVVRAESIGGLKVKGRESEVQTYLVTGLIDEEA